MQSPGQFTDVARAIQLALAPVFLLTGIASLLNVMATRLSRIIDRGRELTESPLGAELPADAVARELQGLEQRRHCTSIAITACTTGALLLCVVIAILFFEVLFNAPVSWLIGVLFTAATIALVIGLAYFLREVHLATRIRIRTHRATPLGS